MSAVASRSLCALSRVAAVRSLLARAQHAITKSSHANTITTNNTARQLHTQPPTTMSSPVPPARVFVNPYANSPSLTADQIATIKSTVPVLAAHGVALTTLFYSKVFKKHPTLKNIFNDAHQKTGAQPRALAGAVYAYAANIDNLGALGPAVALMTTKHASLDILPEHYPVVGSNLLESLDELLTSAGFPRTAVDPIIAAWGVAYGQLANILIEAEEKLYVAAESTPNGWRGWKKFKVAKKEVESHEATSFTLVPLDGSGVPSYLPGQFTTVRAALPVEDPAVGQVWTQPRQYSLSQSSDAKSFRITVKKEEAKEVAAPGKVCPFSGKSGVSMCPAGRVSNHIHTTFAVGSIVELAPPFGAFTLNVADQTPVVLISAGIGVTPVRPMFEHALASNRPVSFLYGCYNSDHHIFKQATKDSLKAGHKQLKTHTWYSHPTEQDIAEKEFDSRGRMNVLQADPELLRLNEQGTDYYICGPESFMVDTLAALKKLNVPDNKVHAELFGTGDVARP